MTVPHGDNPDAGKSAPGMTPGSDGAAPADLATQADLHTPMPDSSPLPSDVGDACTGSCGAGLTCMIWVPDGYCSESCGSAGSSCPTGSTCVDIGNGSRYCLVSASGSCTRCDSSCRDCGAQVCGPA